MTTDLAAWLGAQLDHDEQTYREAAEVDDPERQHRLLRSPDGNESYIVHQALKALRQVAAHRRILAVCVEQPGVEDIGIGYSPEQWLAQRVLLDLAAVYSGRDGHDPAWVVVQ